MNGLGLRFKFQDDFILPGRFSARMGCMAALLLLTLVFLPVTAQASLNLSITINPEPAAAGDYLNVALTVSNTSDYDRSDVVLTLLYPEHLDRLDASYISGDVTTVYGNADPGEFVTWNLGTLQAGTTTTVTLPPRITETTTAGTVIELSPQVSDSSGDETTVSRNVTVTSDRMLELIVAADAEPVQPGDAFTYTLTYGHTATSAVAPDMVLELPLPDGVSFVSATSGATLDGDTIQWTLGTLDPGQIGRAQVTVSVDGATSLGRLLQTQAVFNSLSQTDMIARADTVTRVEDASPLLLAVEAQPEPAVAGEYLDVRFTVSNAGSSDRSDVVLTLRYPEHLDRVDAGYISGDVTTVYGNADSREFVTWDLGTLGAGSSKTVTLPPNITAGTPAGTVIELSPMVYDSTGQVIRVSRCVSVENQRVIELAAAADAEPVQPGTEFTYTLTYGHTATSTVVPDTLLELPLPDSVGFVSATSGGTLEDDIVKWNLGTLDPGQIGRVQVTLAVEASTVLGSLLQSQAVLKSTSDSGIIARVDTVTRVEDAPHLLLAVEVLPEPAVAGEYLDVRLTVSNASSFDRSDVMLKLRYPEHLDRVDAGYISGDVTTVYGNADSREFVTWDLGTLGAGSSKTVTLPPNITAGTPAGTVIELSPMVYDSTGQVSRISRCISVKNQRVFELVAAADVEPVQPGGEFTYTLTYGHTATSTVAPDTLLELPLPDGAVFIAATGNGILEEDLVQWDLGTLEPGQIGRVQVTVAVDDSTALGSLLQTQAVLSSVSQADLIARADTVTQVEEKSPLLLSASVRPEPVEAGEYLDIALTVSNTSTFDRSDVVLKFRYPEHLNRLDASYISGNVTTVYGNADPIEFVTWNIGTLEKGTSRTVTLPPMVTADTTAGTVIELTPQASDSSGVKIMVSRCIAVENERIFELVLNTDMDAVQPGESLTYTLSYGHRATSASVSDAILSLPLPDNVSFVSATGNGTLSNDTVQWSLGTLGPGQVGRKQVTVSVDQTANLGDLLETQAVLASAGYPESTARADAATKVVEAIPLLLSMGVTPDPAGAGDELYGELTVTNTNTFERSNVVLELRYPEHLDRLDAVNISGDVTTVYGNADPIEFVTWNLGTLSAGSAKTVTLPPTVQAAVIDGTIIDFDAVVSDATARSRVEHTVLIGQSASEQDSDPNYIVLTHDTPETVASGSNSIVYGSHEVNVVFLESGAVARLINFPGSNRITILSNSGLFTVSRSGTTVTFTGSDGTSLVMPATSTVQTIIFQDKTLELKISSGAVMLENQTILAESASIE